MFFVCKIWIYIGLKFHWDQRENEKNISYKNMFFSALEFDIFKWRFIICPLFDEFEPVILLYSRNSSESSSFFRRLLWIESNYCVIEWLLIGLDDMISPDRYTRMDTDR